MKHRNTKHHTDISRHARTMSDLVITTLAERQEYLDHLYDIEAGATIIKVAPASMVIPGSLAEWRDWTGLPVDQRGDVHVPGALTPVHCYPDQDQAVYVEPNVWVRHDL
jgi:hypothetical protein